MRIAAVQWPPFADDAPAACAVLVERLRWADGQGVDLILFPEAWLLGHSYDPETIVARACASADALDRLCERTATMRATLVVGAFEMAAGRIFNTAFVIEQGAIAGRYRKAYPNEPGVAAGTDFPAFDRAGVRYGMNICNDANHADAAARIADRQVSLILYPLNNMLRPETAERWRERSIANLRDRARQTGCWIASSDVVGRQGGHVSFGCTAIVAPDGRIVDRVPEGEEGVAIHDLVMG